MKDKNPEKIPFSSEQSTKDMCIASYDDLFQLRNLVDTFSYISVDVGDIECYGQMRKYPISCGVGYEYSDDDLKTDVMVEGYFCKNVSDCAYGTFEMHFVISERYDQTMPEIEKVQQVDVAVFDGHIIVADINAGIMNSVFGINGMLEPEPLTKFDTESLISLFNDLIEEQDKDDSL